MAVTDKQKQIAQDVIENEFFDTLQFYDDYSGRGMSGDRTFGIVGPFDKLMTFLQVFGAQLIEEDESPIETFRMDNMGTDMIIYPFW
ncbi:hypothetical protein EVB55_111 [Rhizobium phage RHph_Y68]|uniref:Uncharacterized protein n=1 Tax=Rhizobium phage RHph_Y68 TaxID=2509787 RepID=A0A7S5UT86_9CAUD|nr:hypothetical protein PP934_gp111 [Rhizobium phage RHph_Y68]QIG68046.1 hypothetical protein EVB55_111 [Rhizobium phage RHph_Y68]